MSNLLKWGFVALFLSIFIIPTISFSATLGVINTNDSGPGSLREVVEALAQDGDEIIFNIPSTPPHTITLTSGQITIGNSITIAGPGVDELIIDGSANERIFQIFSASSDLNVVISGMTITNGLDNAGGAIRNDESLTILDSLISNSSSPIGFGGGGILNNGDVLTIERSTITGNTSNFGGGILNRSGGTLILNLTQVSANMADVNATSTGAGISRQGNAFITDSIIFDNIAYASGGGINNQGAMSINRTTISGNLGNSAGGGGINNSSTDAFVILNSTIAFNTTALGNGAGIRNTRGIIDITNSTIAFNTVPVGSGGGILNQGGVIPSIINIKNSLVVGNTAPTDPNCSDIFAGSTINDVGNNISDNVIDDCAVFFDGAFVTPNMLGSLQDNGWFGLTLDLLTPPGPSNPAVDGVPAGQCTDQAMTPMTITEDGRSFPRPCNDAEDMLCDIGAFELQQTGMLTIEKITVPAGGMGFEFFGSGFPQACDLFESFVLDDMEFLSCILPLDTYSVEENVSTGYALDISCDQSSTTIGSEVTLALADGANSTCTFTNTGIPTLTVQKVGVGTGTVTSAPPGIDFGGDCSEGFDPGTLVTLTALADGGFQPGTWGGACAGFVGEVATVIVDQLKQLKACTISFDVGAFDFNIDLAGDGTGNVTSVPAGIDCGDGGADCMEAYEDGTEVTLIPTPDGSSVFAGFSGDADCADGVVSIDADKTCTATFDFLPLILNPIFPGVGSNVNSIELEQASPNGNVAYIWGFMPGLTTVGGPTCNGIQSGIKDVRLLGIIQAGADQTAMFIVYIPLNPAFQMPVLVQAVDIPTCRVSDVVQNIILNE